MIGFLLRIAFGLAAAALLALSGGYVLNTSTPYGMEQDPNVFGVVFISLAIVGFIVVASARRLWCGWKKVFFYLALILISSPALMAFFVGSLSVGAVSIVTGLVGLGTFFISVVIQCSSRELYKY